MLAARLVLAASLAFLVRDPAPAATFENFADLPVAEIDLDAGIPATPGDEAPVVLGGPDDRALVLELEGFELHALVSTDAGGSFRDVLVCGAEGSPGPGGAPVLGYAAAAAGLDVYAGTIVMDPGGASGIQVVRSRDFGATWDAPVVVASRLDPGGGAYIFGRWAVSVAANQSGRVAVDWGLTAREEIYIATSSNFGGDWTVPVRADDPWSAPAVYRIEAARATLVGPDGVVHLFFVKDGPCGLWGTVTRQLWYVRSVDGVVFSAPRSVAEGQPVETCKNMDYVSATFAGDGGLLVATRNNGRLHVLHSADGGLSFSTAAYVRISGGNGVEYPVIRTAPGRPTVQVVFTANDSYPTPSTYKHVWVMRSADHGRSWGAPVQLGIDSRYEQHYDIVGTSAGWVLFAQPYNALPPAGWHTSLQALSSLDDGLTWGDPVPVDTDESNRGPFDSGGAAVAGGRLVVVWSESGPASDPGHRIVLNDAPADTPAFGSERVIDADRRSVAPASHAIALASDGAGRLYAAFTALAPGPYYDLYLRRSDDDGRTFGPPVRLGDAAPGTLFPTNPRVAALPDGRVYVVFRQARPDFSGRDLLLVRSSDYGVTWTRELTLGVATGCSATSVVCTGSPSPTIDTLLEATEDGRVLVGWHGGGLWFARSLDAGVSFETQRIDQWSGPLYQPSFCTDGGNRVFAAYNADLSLYEYVNKVVMSVDGGATWSAPVDVGLEGWVDYDQPVIVCNRAGRALLTSSAFGTMSAAIANAWDGTSWSAGVVLGETVAWARPILADDGRAMVGFPSRDGAIHVTRSTDGGVTFGPLVRLDDTAPVPEADSGRVDLARDGEARVWAFWLDGGAGQEMSVVGRASPDFGLSWGPVLRLGNDTPQGNRHVENAFDDAAYDIPLDARSGRVAAGFHAQRATTHVEAVLVVWEPGDLDRDGAPAAQDCLDTDAGAIALPPEVTGLTVAPAAGSYRISWFDVSGAAGSGTRYAVVGGPAEGLDAGAFGSARCVGSNLPATHHDDPGTPEPGGAIYYLVRASNACGAGTFGDSGLDPDPRDGLDAAPPCP